MRWAIGSVVSNGVGHWVTLRHGESPATLCGTSGTRAAAVACVDTAETSNTPTVTDTAVNVLIGRSGATYSSLLLVSSISGSQASHRSRWTAPLMPPLFVGTVKRVLARGVDNVGRDRLMTMSTSEYGNAQGPLAVVAGASSGIGLALARQFTERDVDVRIAADDARVQEAERTRRRPSPPTSSPTRRPPPCMRA